jgi:hypothetical protein
MSWWAGAYQKPTLRNVVSAEWRKKAMTVVAQIFINKYSLKTHIKKLTLLLVYHILPAYQYYPRLMPLLIFFTLSPPYEVWQFIRRLS